MIRLGAHASLWTPKWSREAAEKFIPEAARNGITAIEINPYDFADDAAIDHSARLFSKHDVLPICSVGLPPAIGAPLKIAEAARFLDKAIERAARVGAQLLTGLTYATLGYKSGMPATDAEYRDIVTLLKPAARRAAEHGLTIGIEACNRYETHLLNTGAQGAMLQEMIGASNVTVHLDTYHMNIEEESFAAGFRSVKGRCRYVHLSESNRGAFGKGTIDWEKVFAGLAEIGFDGNLTIESFVNVPEEFKAALSVWRPVAENADVVVESTFLLREKAKKHGLALAGG